MNNNSNLCYYPINMFKARPQSINPFCKNVNLNTCILTRQSVTLNCRCRHGRLHVAAVINSNYVIVVM